MCLPALYHYRYVPTYIVSLQICTYIISVHICLPTLYHNRCVYPHYSITDMCLPTLYHSRYVSIYIISVCQRQNFFYIRSSKLRDGIVTSLLISTVAWPCVKYWFGVEFMYRISVLFCHFLNHMLFHVIKGVKNWCSPRIAPIKDILGCAQAMPLYPSRVSDKGTTLRACDLHNARPPILNPFNRPVTTFIILIQIRG